MRFVFLIAAGAIPALSFAQAAPGTVVHATPAALPGHGVPPAQESRLRGDRAFLAHDLDGATAAYREAAQRDARSAAVQLRLASVARARDDAASALGMYREAARLAAEANDDWSRARALCGIAEVYEAQAQWRDASSAWAAVREFANAHSSTLFLGIATSRIEVIQRREQLERDYAAVRERIAERLRVNAAGPATPPGMAPVPGR